LALFAWLDNKSQAFYSDSSSNLQKVSPSRRLSSFATLRTSLRDVVQDRQGFTVDLSTQFPSVSILNALPPVTALRSDPRASNSIEYSPTFPPYRCNADDRHALIVLLCAR